MSSKSFRKFTDGIKLKEKASSTSTSGSEGKGDLEVLSSGKLNYNNGTTVSSVVTETHSATLTNKTLTSPVLNTATADTISSISGTIIVEGTTQATLRATGNGSTTISSTGSGSTTITSGSGGLTITAGTAVDSNPVTIENISIKDTTITAGILGLQNFFLSDTDITNTSAINIYPTNNQTLSLKASGTGQVALGNSAAASVTVQTNSDLIVNKKAVLVGSTNSQTGSSVTINTTTSPYVKLTASITSISGITSSAKDGQLLLITNSTGAAIQILNEDGGASAPNRIVTGLGAAATLGDAGSVLLVYNTTTSRWNLLSGNQTSTINLPNVQTITSTGTTTLSNTTNDYVLVNATGVTIQLPTTPLSGKTFNIKKIYNDSVPVTIQCATATIDGVASVTITDRYDSLTITTDGINYFII